MLTVQKLLIPAAIKVLFLTLTVVSSNLLHAAVGETASISTVSVYTWQQSTTGDWQSPSNWTPARTTPASSDVLVFNFGGTTTVTNVPTEAIGQLIVSGDTTVNLQSAQAIVLTIGGAEGGDLIVDPNSALNFNAVNAITINLANGATAHINGLMTFSSPGATAHRLTAVDAAAVIFGDGGVFAAGTGFTGSPFGTTNLNSVVFDFGSTYVSVGGDDPFGAAEPASVVVFKSGSLFLIEGNANMSFSGRTYANFELNYPGGDVFAIGSSALVMDDLTITAGTFHIWVTGTPGHSIKGNISTMPGTRLDMQAVFPGQTINLNGSTPQTITIRASVGVNPGNTIAIDNPSGIAVNTVFGAWNLELINGVVTITDPSGFFDVSGTASRTNGYINGYIHHFFSEPGSFLFTVGTKNGYSPVLANVTAGTFPADLYVKAIQSIQPNIFDSSKALSRYWSVLNGFGVTADLTFHYLDPADIPATANEANFVIQRYNNGFTQPAGVIDTQANTFRVTGLTDLSMADWTLAEPGALGSPTATATPTATNTPTSTPTNTPTATPTSTPGHATAFDYDGDHKADISVFRLTDGAWYLQQSQAGFFGAQFGIGTDKITPADFDGDGMTDIAVYRPSTGIWYVLNSSNGTVTYYVFGLSEDLPTPADYDGDGKADVSVFRPSTGTWYRQNSGNGSFFGVQFGASEDKPTVGDFDGDGKSDIAVFRPSTGAWYRINSSDGSIFGQLFGFGSDVLAPADYDGDGKTDVAVYRPSTGIWYIQNSSNSEVAYNIFGLAADIPAPGDFDGDGKADVCVFRPSDGNWYRQNSSNAQFVAFHFGTNGDKPTMTAFRY